jgi:hypothetical protein
LEQFLRELSPIEEYNRNPVHGIDVKRNPVILDTQLAYLELVNPPHLTQHLPWQPEHPLAVVNIRRYPTPDLLSYSTPASFAGKHFPLPF